jgi:hypothetical protein
MSMAIKLLIVGGAVLLSAAGFYVGVRMSITFPDEHGVMDGDR